MPVKAYKKIIVTCVFAFLFFPIVRYGIDYYNEAQRKRTFVDIYNGYEEEMKGREAVYGFFEEGDMDIANDYLDDIHYVNTFGSIKFETLTWEENPYGERYWCFIFYSLRTMRHLLYAYQETEKIEYLHKVSEIVNSYIDVGLYKEHSWDDLHGVAFRTMSLVNIWSKLRQYEYLDPELSNKILKTLLLHGDFLLQDDHYEALHNHGVNQSVALLVLALNFPQLDNSGIWLSKARERLISGAHTLVDNDGALVENAPYYHFYVLKKYWDILQYAKKFDFSLVADFEKVVNNMIAYGEYILQPNGEVPLLGASLKEKIEIVGKYAEFAELNPHFKFAITQGKQGEKPVAVSNHFPFAGQTIMRSGWGEDRSFHLETQLIFDVGDYRTNHSDFDALSFNLYGAGMPLIIDSGLYTYEKGVWRDYFHGTWGHNTVVVDGLDQKKGASIIGDFKEMEGYVYQSASHTLYSGVTHRRIMALIKEDLVLLYDRLESEDEHNYKQLFHFVPELKIDIKKEGVLGYDIENKEKVFVQQFLTNGIAVEAAIGEEDPPRGFCSYKYEKKIPCQMVWYEKNGKNQSFLTTIEVGKKDPGLRVAMSEEGIIEVAYKGRLYQIDINK